MEFSNFWNLFNFYIIYMNINFLVCQKWTKILNKVYHKLLLGLYKGIENLKITKFRVLPCIIYVFRTSLRIFFYYKRYIVAYNNKSNSFLYYTFHFPTYNSDPPVVLSFQYFIFSENVSFSCLPPPYSWYVIITSVWVVH